MEKNVCWREQRNSEEETKIRKESVQEIKVLEKCGVVNKNIHTKPLKWDIL